MNTHASLILASKPDITLLPEDCREASVDVQHEFAEVFTIERVRILKDIVYRLPVNLRNRWVVIWAQEYTHAAQNALLKMLEEPPLQTKFILMTGQITQLLPTVRSRLQVLDSGSLLRDTEGDYKAGEWINLSVAKRLERVQELHKQNDKDSLLKLILAVVNLVSNKDVDMSLEQRRIIADVTGFIHRSGSSKKYLLEILALTLPAQVNDPVI